MFQEWVESVSIPARRGDHMLAERELERVDIEREGAPDPLAQAAPLHDLLVAVIEHQRIERGIGAINALFRGVEEDV